MASLRCVASSSYPYPAQVFRSRTNKFNNKTCQRNLIVDLCQKKSVYWALASKQARFIDT